VHWFQAMDAFFNSVYSLYSAPRIPEPIWLSMMTSSSERSQLCSNFLSEFVSLTKKCDTKSSKLWVEILLIFIAFLQGGSRKWHTLMKTVAVLIKCFVLGWSTTAVLHQFFSWSWCPSLRTSIDIKFFWFQQNLVCRQKLGEWYTTVYRMTRSRWWSQRCESCGKANFQVCLFHQYACNQNTNGEVWYPRQ